MRPEEAIALPFLVLLIVLNLYFHLPPKFNLPFILWFIIIFILYVTVIIFIQLFKIYFFNRGAQFGFSIRNLAAALRDIVPIFLILIVYENLHDLIPYISRHDHDAALLVADRILFGPVHPTILFQSIVTPALTQWMSFAYLTFFFYLPILFCVFHYQRQYRAQRLLVLAISLTAYFGFVCYALVPAIGPWYTLAHQYSVDLQGHLYNAFTNPIIADLSIARDVFPSLHVAMSIVYLWLALKFARPWFYIFLPFVISLWVSTIYLRYHYVIDIIAGSILSGITIYLTTHIYDWWYDQHETTPNH